MKWTYIIQQKIKVALLLTCILLLVIITNLMGEKNIRDMNESFTSIYQDRLIPATDIFHLRENLYSKMFLVEKFLLSEDGNILKLQEDLNKHDTTIYFLIHKFEQTYLVDQEQQSLKKFKEKIIHYNQIEKLVLELSEKESKEKGRQLYESEGKLQAQNTIKSLSELMEIQSSIGKDLMEVSEDIVYRNKLLSFIQISLAIIIGGIIQALILSSRLIDKSDNKDFNLN